MQKRYPDFFGLPSFIPSPTKQHADHWRDYTSVFGSFEQVLAIADSPVCVPREGKSRYQAALLSPLPDCLHYLCSRTLRTRCELLDLENLRHAKS